MTFDSLEFRNGTINQANVLYSDDHGRTWKPGGSIGYEEHQPTGNAIHSNEAQVSLYPRAVFSCNHNSNSLMNCFRRVS